MIQIVIALFCLTSIQHLLAKELVRTRTRTRIATTTTTTTTTEPPPPQPYEFSFVGERAPGLIDRTHAEAGDSDGVVRGQFSYIDPAQRIRTVDYVADKQGFHPIVSVPVKDTRTVAKAKLEHARLYNKLAAQNLNNAPSSLPAQSRAVEDARLKHFRLYEAIAAQHARVGAQRKAQQQALEEDADLPHAAQHARVGAQRKAQQQALEEDADLPQHEEQITRN